MIKIQGRIFVGTGHIHITDGSEYELSVGHQGLVLYKMNPDGSPDMSKSFAFDNINDLAEKLKDGEK